MSSKIQSAARSIGGGIVLCLFALAVAAGTSAGAEADKNLPKSVKLEIRNRLFPDFVEVVETAMNQKTQIGDSDYSFEVIEFYPHFAITDSTKKVVSLSDEPKNPAFKIRVYENDKPLEDAWAFFGVKIPHFSRTAYLMFSVLRFDYRGKVYGGDENDKPNEESDGGKKS